MVATATFADDLALDTNLDCEFEVDTHAYYDEGGARVLSVTQALKLAGMVSYDHVPPAVLENARRRGVLVHELCAEIDKGVEVDACFDIPEPIVPYVDAYRLFVEESGFEVDPENVERRRIVTVANMRVAMTPDCTGILNGIPVVIDRKTCEAFHPSWGPQTAAYESGLPRPARFRSYDRFALQLRRNGRYKLQPLREPTDFNVFCASFTVAQYKLKNRLATID